MDTSQAMKETQEMHVYQKALGTAIDFVEFVLASKVWQRMKEANIQLAPEHMSGYPFHHGEISSLGEKYLTENGITKEEYDLWFKKCDDMYRSFSPLANELPEDMYWLDRKYNDSKDAWHKSPEPIRHKIMELVSDPVITSLLSVE